MNSSVQPAQAPALRWSLWVVLLAAAGVFALTQIPLAVIEGLLTVIVVNLLSQYSRDDLDELAFAPGGAK